MNSLPISSGCWKIVISLHFDKVERLQVRVNHTDLHPTSVKEHVEPALDARPRLAPLRDVDVTEGLHARVVRRIAGEELVLDGWNGSKSLFS